MNERNGEKGEKGDRGRVHFVNNAIGRGRYGN